jgi:hypothetical protein
MTRLQLDGGRREAAPLAGAGQPAVEPPRGPDCFYFSFQDLIAFYFLLKDLIAFLFSVQGTLCKKIDSQLIQSTKQHLSLTCMNTRNLPNM